MKRSFGHIEQRAQPPMQTQTLYHPHQEQHQQHQQQMTFGPRLDATTASAIPILQQTAAAYPSPYPAIIRPPPPTGLDVATQYIAYPQHLPQQQHPAYGHPQLFYIDTSAPSTSAMQRQRQQQHQSSAQQQQRIVPPPPTGFAPAYIQAAGNYAAAAAAAVVQHAPKPTSLARGNAVATPPPPPPTGGGGSPLNRQLLPPVPPTAAGRGGRPIRAPAAATIGGGGGGGGGGSGAVVDQKGLDNLSIADRRKLGRTDRYEAHPSEIYCNRAVGVEMGCVCAESALTPLEICVTLYLRNRNRMYQNRDDTI